MDDEVRNLIKEATERTKSILLANKQAVENLSNVLMEKESLDLKGIIEILGDRPFKPKKNFEEYLETKKLIESEEITEETIKKTE